MISLEPVSGIAPVVTAGTPNTVASSQAVKDFESLFVETLLQNAGLARTLETQGGAEGGMAGELLVRELARGLADQLQLDFGRSLGIGSNTQLPEENVP
jgi:hypothetical protein